MEQFDFRDVRLGDVGGVGVRLETGRGADVNGLRFATVIVTSPSAASSSSSSSSFPSGRTSEASGGGGGGGGNSIIGGEGNHGEDAVELFPSRDGDGTTATTTTEDLVMRGVEMETLQRRRENVEALADMLNGDGVRWCTLSFVLTHELEWRTVSNSYRSELTFGFKCTFQIQLATLRRGRGGLVV